jgi:hypothetical protein
MTDLTTLESEEHRPDPCEDGRWFEKHPERRFRVRGNICIVKKKDGRLERCQFALPGVDPRADHYVQLMTDIALEFLTGVNLVVLPE